MAKYGFIAQIGGDTKGLTAALKDVDKAGKEINSELRQVNQALKLDPSNVTLISQKMTLLSEKSQETREKLRVLKEQQDAVAEAVRSGKMDAAAYREYQREIAKCEAELKNIEKQQAAAKGSTEELGQSVKKSGDRFKDAEKDVKSYKDAVGDLKSAMKDVSDDLSGLAKLAGGAVGAVGAAAVGGIKSVVEVGSSFEKSMSRVEAISGASADDLEKLKNAAKEMGATTSKTASESADALSYMALAGWKTEDMLTGLEPILRASEAGEMDLATCSDLVTDSMSAMGVETKDLAHYLDVVSAAQSNSNTNMQQLLEAFVECGGSAHNFGLNVEDLSTVLGVMANRGVKGTEAGTALNSIFVNMLGSTAKTAEAMDTLGLSLYDSEGNMKDVTEVLKEMGGALESATDEQRNNLEAMLGGKTQITALQAMVNGLNGEYDDLSATLYDCDGALLKTAETMQDNLTGDMTILSSGLEALGNEVYEYLEEPLRNAVQTATREISGLTESVTNGQLSETISRLAESFGKLIEKTAKFAADKGIPALINTLDWISQNGDKIVAAIEGMGAAWATWKIANMATHVQTLIKAIKDFKVAQEAATAAQIAANEAAMANVYAAVAAAVVGLTAALAKLAANWIDEGRENLAAKNQLDETTQSLRDQAAAIEEKNEAYNTQAAEAEKTAEKERALWEEIQSLVDEEGNATTESGRLGDAINELNTLAGTNIQLTNGQIQGYKGLKGSMDDIIKAQERQAKLSYLENDYGEALINIDDVTKQYEQANLNAKKWCEENEKLTGYWNEWKNTGIIPDEWEGSLDDLKNSMDSAGDKAATFTVQANSLRDTMDGYQETIDKYNTILGEEQTTSESAGEDAGGAFGDGFAEGVDDGTGAMTDAANAAVDSLAAESQNTGEQAGVSIGIATIDGIEQGVKDGMEESDLKKKINEYIKGLKYEQARDGKSDSWLYDEEEKMLSVLPENSALYQEFMTDVINGRKKIAEEQQKQQDKEDAQREEDKKKLESDYKERFDTIYSQLENEEITREEFNAKYLDLVEECGEKQIDISKYTADKIADYDKKIRDENLSVWEKSSKEISDRITKAYEDVTAAYEKARDGYISSLSLVKEKITDNTGKERYVLEDFKKQTQDIRRYQESVEKLKATGISDDLMNQIMSLSYDSGERQGVINEILNITEKQRAKYYADSDKYFAAVNDAAKADTSDKLAEADKIAKEGIEKIYSDLPQESYQKGMETAQSYLQGIMDGMSQTDTLRLMGADNSTAAANSKAQGGSPPSGAAAGNWFSGDMKIVIDVGGKQQTFTLNDIVKNNVLTGGNTLNV